MLADFGAFGVQAVMISGIPSSIVQELHKLASDGSVLYLLEIPYEPNHSLDIRLARNTDDVVWLGNTFLKSWFEIETIEESGAGNVPELHIIMSNIGGLVEDQIIQRDNLNGCQATLYFVNSKFLGYSTPIFSATFDVMKPSCNRLTASIKLSVENPLLLNYPSWKYHGSLCQYPKFPGDPRCPYSGGLTTCNRTLTDCITRWGGVVTYLPFGGQLGLSGEIQADASL